MGKHKANGATNFKRLLVDLKRAGVSDSEVAREVTKGGVQVSQPTISRIRQGGIKQPHYDLGVALVALHEQRVIRDSAA